jgi:hypothetical protein
MKVSPRASANDFRGISVSDFDHYVITRFNARQGRERASDDWLRHRLVYFQSLCYRSVVTQTNRNFVWLVFFDSERDAWFQKEIDRLCVGAFVPIWVEGALTTEVIANAIAMRSSAPWLITTRIDNDDAIAPDFIERLHQEFHEQTFEFVNFSRGLQLTEGGAVYSWTDPTSPFISLIERKPEEGLSRTVHIDGHDRLRNHGPVRQVSAPPMWVQMVHGKNIANAVKGVRARPSELTRFTIDREMVPVTEVRLRLAQARNIAGLATRVLSEPRRIGKAARILRDRIRR